MSTTATKDLSLGVTSKKSAYIKTLSNQVGGWSRPFQKNFNELIFELNELINNEDTTYF